MANENTDKTDSAPPMEVPHVLLALVAAAAVALLGTFTAIEMIGTTLAAAPSTPHVAHTATG